MIQDHYDAVAVVVVGVLMLAFIELRLRALFTLHEKREERMHAASQLLADSATAAAREAVRHIHEIRAEIAEQRESVANLGELLKIQEGRLVAVETRLVRVSVSVPRPFREPQEDP